MGVLAMLELEGDIERLLAAMRELDRLLATPPGLQARITAPTPSGMVLLQLWESAEARAANAADPVHARALVESGMRAAVSGSRSHVFDGAELHVPAPR